MANQGASASNQDGTLMLGVGPDGKMYPSGLDGPATKIAEVTSGENLADGVCRALLVGTAGTATVVDASGNTSSNIPLQAGYNPICVSKVTLGTAANVWALY